MKPYLPALMCMLLLGTAGCGQTSPAPSAAASSGPVSTDGPQAGALTVKDFAGRQVSFPRPPKSFVALGNGEMDIVYALGGGVVGRPTSDGPLPNQAAAKVPQIGSTHGIDLEKVASVSPDIVLGNNPLNTKDIATVESLGAKMVLTSANSVDEVKQQIRLIGQLMQKDDKASELVKTIDDKIAKLKGTQPPARTRVLLVYGAPGTYMAALNNSLSGDLLGLAGGENIAADYPSLQNYPQYAQLNAEKIVKSNPQVVLLMSHGNSDKVKEGFMKEMAQNAAWNGIDAVRANRVAVLPNDLFGTNPGTRITEALDMLSGLLQGAK